MAAPVTARYDQMTLEVETTTPGTYARLCGLRDMTVSRALAVDEDEIPDCDDETLPFGVDVNPRSLTVTISAEGVWAQSNHDLMLKWVSLAQTKNVRIRHAAALVGDVEFESGPALLTKLDHEKTKGKVVSASIEIRIKGNPTLTDRAA